LQKLRKAEAEAGNSSTAGKLFSTAVCKNVIEIKPVNFIFNVKEL